MEEGEIHDEYQQQQQEVGGCELIDELRTCFGDGDVGDVNNNDNEMSIEIKKGDEYTTEMMSEVTNEATHDTSYEHQSGEASTTYWALQFPIFTHVIEDNNMNEVEQQQPQPPPPPPLSTIHNSCGVDLIAYYSLSSDGDDDDDFVMGNQIANQQSGLTNDNAKNDDDKQQSTNNNKTKRKFPCSNFFKAVKWSPNGAHLLSNSDDRSLRLYSTYLSLPPPPPHH